MLTPSRRCPLCCVQSDWAKNKWKGAVFVGVVTLLGVVVPVKCMSFAQKKAGVW